MLNNQSQYFVNPWIVRLISGFVVYGILIVSSKFLVLFPAGPVSLYRADPYLMELILFSFTWLFLLIAAFLLILRKSFRIEWKNLYLYVGMMAFIGPIGEVFINSFCRFFFGSPLWTYLIFPVHNGDTSKYSFFLWSLYGIYLYFLHQKFPLDFQQKKYYLAPSFIMAFDAITLEFLMNISSLVFLSTFIFYYFPSDVLHLTTLAASPFYFVGGIVVIRTLKRFSRDPWFFGTMSFLIAATFIFLGS